MEDRVAVLEANIEHIRSDMSEMKTDIRRLNDKVDALDEKLTTKGDGLDLKLTTKIDQVEEKLTAKIDAVDQKLTAKFDALKDALSALALNMEQSFGALKVARVVDRVWWLLIAGALLGVMARGFKWI